MSRLVVGATWDEAPHLTEDAKEALWNSIPPYQRDARAKGIPQLGAGAIYPFAESGIKVTPFEIPKHWPRCWGLDCALSGTTAASWGALDRDTSVLYIYSVYKQAQAATTVHAEAFTGRGRWIPGAGDAADVVDSDRTRFIDQYKAHGFDLTLPNKAVETGIQAVYDRLQAGKLKVFASCPEWFSEFRVYRRDKRGRVVKVNDHIMDATRYLVMTALERARTPPADMPAEERYVYEVGGQRSNWMAR